MNLSAAEESLCPISIVNDPYEIAKNENFVSINSCLMSDLTGQVCSETLGHSIYSCIGGQLEYVTIDPRM